MKISSLVPIMVLSLMLSASLKGQEDTSTITFNKRVHFDYFSALLSDVLPTEDGYYCTGLVSDTVAPYSGLGVFAQLDIHGDAISISAVGEIGKQYDLYESLQWENDSTLVVRGGMKGGGEHEMVLFFLNTHTNEITAHHYSNPSTNLDDFIYPAGGGVILDDGHILTNSNATYPLNSDSGDKEIYISLVDSTRNIVWDTLYFHPLSQAAGSTAKDQSGHVWLSWTINDDIFTHDGQTFRIKLRKLSPDGRTVLWDYTTPDEIGNVAYPYRMNVLRNGSLVFPANIIQEKNIGQNNNYYIPYAQLMHFDPNTEEYWLLRVDDHISETGTYVKDVVEASDSSGIVFAGATARWSPQNQFWATIGYIAKASYEGELLWKRDYVGIDEGLPFHRVFSIKSTPDGGYILCGDSSDGTSEQLPYQQGWLLKVDQHGCLVPGCHLLDTDTEETDIPNPMRLTVHPNPVVDYLNFQFRGLTTPLRDGWVRLYDTNGRVVASVELSIVQPGDTFVLPIYERAAGHYLLRYESADGNTNISKSVIISR